MADKQKLMLIDGNSLAYRAYFSHMEFRTSGGQATGAIFGFLRMLEKVLKDEAPTHVIVAFDMPGGTFRDEMYAEYKANRQAAPDDFKSQLPLLRDVLKALRVHYVMVPRLEADDLIGTLSRQAEEQGVATVIVTGDRDALQLVSDHTTVLLTRKGVTDLVVMDPANVKETYGVTPAQIVDLKALMGDASDNIPGVPGVGEKTAAKLIQEYGSVEAALEAAPNIKGKLGERLREHAGDARLSRELATTKRDADDRAPLNMGCCQVTEPDYPEIQRLYRELEFRSMLAKVTPGGGANGEATAAGAAATAGAAPEAPPEAASGPAPADVEVTVIRQLAPAIGVAPSLAKAPAVLAAMQPLMPIEPVPPSGRLQPRGVAVAVGGKAVWVDGPAAAGLDGIWPLAQDSTGFDMKPYFTWLLRRGARPAAPGYDAMLAAYLLDPGRNSYRLEDLARQYGLGDLPEGDTPRDWGARAAALPALRERQGRHLRENGLWELFTGLEMPLLPLLARMEAYGIGVDKAGLEEMGAELKERIEHIQAEIWGEVGYNFNLNSPKQLADVLFEKLGLPVLKRTKTGPSTDAEVLEELAAQAPVVDKILGYRTLVKLHGTYVEGLKGLVEADGRVHTTFNQTVAATGRLSSTDPNLQNIPIRIEEGRRIRKVFVPAAGWVLYAADYSQIELRIVAHYSGDEALLDAFRKDQDIHTRTAAEVYGVTMDAVSKDMRRNAKAVNFGLIYGQTDYGLARALGISRGEAREFITRYFERYPGIKSYMDDKIREAKENGYVTTMMGRRRPLPDIHARTYTIRQNAERAAINTPIQGTAADLMKKAMLLVHGALQESGLQARMLLQVHDELVFECPPDEVPALHALVCREMESAMAFAVPLKVEGKTGRNWYDMQAVSHA